MLGNSILPYIALTESGVVFLSHTGGQAFLTSFVCYAIGIPLSAFFLKILWSCALAQMASTVKLAKLFGIYIQLLMGHGIYIQVFKGATSSFVYFEKFG